MADRNEILTVCVGNCGIFAGNEYYSTIMKEHKVNKNGVFTGNFKNENDRLLLNKIDAYFDESKTNKYTPRAMFLDIDKTPINAIKASPLGPLLNDNNMLSSDYCEPTSIYPKAYFDSGADIIDTVMDKIRKQIEVCNYFQGINMIHSISGGCGSGLASLLLCKMKDEYPKKHNFSHTIWPCLSSWRSGSVHSSRNNNIEIYNCILAINQLLEYTEMNFVIDNSALLYALYTKCGQKKVDYNDMNWILSLILSGITSPFRFISESNVCSNLKKMDQCFRVFPRLKFMTVCHSPFFPKIDYKYNDHNISIINDVYDNPNIMNRVKIENGKLLVTGTYYRSNDTNAINNMNKFMRGIQQKMADDFVQWIPHNVTSTFIYDGGFECYKNMTTLMGTTLMNTTAIKSMFQMISASFARPFKRKCYLHYYKNEGMNATDFQIADKNVRDLVTEYQDTQDAIVEHYVGDESDSAEYNTEEDSY